MRRIVLTFGLIAGAILAGMMLLSTWFSERIGFDSAEVIGYTSMVAAFLMVWFGVRAYRDQVAGGALGFWQGLRVGLLIVAVASVCYVATWEVIYTRVWPDFGERYAAHQLDQARAAGATEEELARQAAQMDEFREMYANPAIRAAITFLEPLPVGLLMSLIAAGTLRRKAGGGPDDSSPQEA